MTRSQLLSISFYQLEVFFSLAKTLNFTQTALELNMTQPSVSRNLSKLEDNLGIRLFQRTTKSVTLTPMGESCYQSWQGVLETLNHGYAKACAKQMAYEGELSIGVSHLLNCDILPNQYFKPFKEAYNTIKFNVVDVGLENALSQNLVDVMLMPDTCQYQLNPDDFSWQYIGENPLYILISDKHPFAKYKSIRMEEILDIPVLVLSPTISDGPRELLQSFYKPFGAVPIIERYFCSSYEIESLLDDCRCMCVVDEFFPSATLINTAKVLISNQYSETIVLWRNHCENPHVTTFIDFLLNLRG